MFLKILFLSTALFLTACQANSSTPAPGSTLSKSAGTASPPAALEPAAAQQPTSQPAPQPTSPTTTPRPYGGTVVLGLVGRPDSLNPITDSNPALRELTPLLYDSLLRADPHTARLQPGLAERWEYTNARQKLLFHLPPDLKWSNGSPMTAPSIASSLKASQHPALRAFSNINASDDTTLTLTFKAIDCSAVTNLALLPLLPTSQITATRPVGSGPYIVDEWPANKRTLILSRNPYYREPAPILDGFIVRFLQDDEVAIALSEGQFDIAGPLATAPPELATPQFTDMAYPAPQVVYLAMNYDPKNGDPLPPNLREALSLAPDRETILADALGGDGQLMAGSLLPGHWAAKADLPHPAFDPDTARNLLRNAGLRDTTGDGWLDENGKQLELGIRLNGQNELYQDLGWLLSSYFRDLGLFVRAESVPVDSVIDDLFTHDFSLAIFSWPLLPDPDQRLYWHSAENSEGIGLNFTSYRNPELDRLLEEAVAIPGCPVDERATIYADIQQILAEERPVDFLLTPNRHILVADRLHGVEPGPFAPLTWNITGWRLQKE